MFTNPVLLLLLLFNKGNCEKREGNVVAEWEQGWIAWGRGRERPYKSWNKAP
jgi:hypothetical protein